MPQSARPLPRFIPTLTEVVQGPLASQASAANGSADAEPLPGAAVEDVQRRIHAAVQASVLPLIDEIVAARLADMRLRLVTDIDRLLHEKLSALVASELANRGVS